MGKKKLGRKKLQEKSLKEYKKYCKKNGEYAVGYAHWLKRTGITLKRKKKLWQSLGGV